jgi:ComF family protein
MRNLINRLTHKDIHLLEDFLLLVYPNCCECCNGKLLKYEELICSSCRIDLPRVNIIDLKDNQVHLRLAGRFPIVYAYTFYHYRKRSGVQALLRSLKYKGIKEVGTLVGQWIGAELLKMNMTDEMVIVPIPLHASRIRQRGYNQSEYIANGVAKMIQMAVNTTDLIKKESTNSQTIKGRWARWANVAHIYQASENLKGKHVLLVDDVITTGATLEACANALIEAGVTEISILSMAMADKNEF